MATKKYPSRYSPSKFVAPHQYIIELVCEKNAKINGRDLPVQFWKLPEWNQFYRAQLRKCQELLRKYRDESIIKALNDPRCYKTYSLYGPWLEKIVVEYEKQQSVKLPDEEQPDMSGVVYIRKERKNNNLLDRLDEPS